MQSVATTPRQVRRINEFIAAEVAQGGGRLTGLGTLHPESEDIAGDVAHLLSLGLRGDVYKRQLFLNATLTCRAGAPLSHKRLWEPFARELVAYIDAARGAEAAWFLWGADARGYGAYIARGKRYESRHPMMAGGEPDGFLQNPCFVETSAMISWTGL